MIRLAAPDDIDAILALWQRAGSTPSVTDNADALQRVIEATHARVFVAEEATVVVGSIIATFDGWRGNVYRLAVDPDFRRRGLALALVRAADEWFADVGTQRVTALVEGSRPEAQAFWSAAGFDWQDGMRRYVKTLHSIA